MSDRSRRKRAKVDYTEVKIEEPQIVAKDESTCASVKEYRARLIEGNKELYKDPPALPPADTSVLEGRQPIMTRNKKGELTTAGFPEFRPNLTPAEVFQRGSFGGTYYRPINSAVTDRSYSAEEVLAEFPSEWFEGISIKSLVTCATYDAKKNKYGVKCGGSLGMWESSGWISDIDPYGWFQWYCRFYLGRRSTDDERQISRWKSGHGPTGRFRSQLMNKILAAKTTVDDPKISPVVRQTCQHWGYVPTQQDLDAHRKKKGF